MTPAWKDYQEEAASFFRSIGAEASTDVTLEGVRTKHAIDVLVTMDAAGFETRWAIECKLWKTPVSKLHVLGLRTIVADLGLDRGFILCEVGFQSGAAEAADFTNVQVASLQALRVSSKNAVYSVRLRNLYDRAKESRARYWDIPKDVRIEKGLRFDGPSEGNLYSGARIVDFVDDLIGRAVRGIYPIDASDLFLLSHPDIPTFYADAEAVVAVVEPLIADLETRLAAV